MFEGNFGSKFFTFELDDWVFTETTAREKLLKHFEVKNLKGFGVEHLKNGIIASGAILQYLIMEEDKYVRLDKFTVRSLELMGSMNDGGSSLLSVIDRTICPMGARLMKRWLVFPLKDVRPINDRLDVVEYFFRQPDFRDLVEEQLHRIGDLERILSKVAVGRVSPREVVALKVALQAVEPIKQACLEADNASLNRIGEQLNVCQSIRDRIDREINNDPPLLVNKGGVIKQGVSVELDELRQIAYSGKDYLLQLQQRESELTGIPSLKIGYNNVFGYYIEVRNVHKDKVPQEWIRKQTLVNAERYITQELKEYEEKILGAEDKILVLETQLYNELVQALSEFIPAIQINANQVACLDCLLSFATAARENNYIRPVLSDDDVLDIRQGRHPVIEKQLPIGEKYVANDVMLDSQTQQIIIITGPNMAGKSALLRQTALITLMAQIGCFVPAESAHIGLVDKIFTRVGASDNISVGESTFMVEMNEAADILNNLSPRSLVLFDELGRGTSTYDGISIAWAIVEYIHEHPHGEELRPHQELQRGGEGGGRQGHLPAQAGAGRQRALFRYPRGQAGRHAQEHREARRRNPEAAGAREPPDGYCHGQDHHRRAFVGRRHAAQLLPAGRSRAVPDTRRDTEPRREQPDAPRGAEQAERHQAHRQREIKYPVFEND